jgi:hypothetical protein
MTLPAPIQNAYAHLLASSRSYQAGFATPGPAQTTYQPPLTPAHQLRPSTNVPFQPPTHQHYVPSSQMGIGQPERPRSWAASPHQHTPPGGLCPQYGTPQQPNFPSFVATSAKASHSQPIPVSAGQNMNQPMINNGPVSNGAADRRQTTTTAPLLQLPPPKTCFTAPAPVGAPINPMVSVYGQIQPPQHVSRLPFSTSPMNGHVQQPLNGSNLPFPLLSTTGQNQQPQSASGLPFSMPLMSGQIYQPQNLPEISPGCLSQHQQQ